MLEPSSGSMRPRATASLAAMVVRMCLFTSAPFRAMATASWRLNSRWSFPWRKAPRAYRLPTWCRFRKTKPEGRSFANKRDRPQKAVPFLFFPGGIVDVFAWCQHPPTARAKIENIQYQVFVADIFSFGLQAQVAPVRGEAGQGVDLHYTRIALLIETDIRA